MQMMLMLRFRTNDSYTMATWTLFATSSDSIVQVAPVVLNSQLPCGGLVCRGGQHRFDSLCVTPIDLAGRLLAARLIWMFFERVYEDTQKQLSYRTGIQWTYTYPSRNQN